MSSAKVRFQSLKGSSKKRSKFGELRVLMGLFILIGLSLVYMAPRFKVGNLVSDAFTKQSKGIVLNYFYMTPKRAGEILGEPHSKTPYREEEELYYWKFDPVTLEIHYHEEKVARVAFATSDELIRDHIEGRALKVYAREEDWQLQRRNIDGEFRVVYENVPGQMTVVKYAKSVMVYHYLFPDKLAMVSE